MSNSESSKINIDAANEALTAWGVAISNFNLGKLTASKEKFFQALFDVGLDNGFIKSYDQNNVALENALNSSKTSILNSLENMHNLDDEVMKDLEELLGLKPKTSEDGGGGGNTPSTQTTPHTPTSTDLLDNSKEQLALYKNMSMSDLNAVAQDLMKYANENGLTLDQLLNDSQYATKIHSRLLLSQHIPDDFKLLIEAGKTNISQKILCSIFSGKEPELVGLNENTTKVIKQYLMMVASSNNITIEQLLNNEQYSKVLSDSLKSFDNVTGYISNLKENEVIPSLLSIYDGASQENMTSGGMSIMRAYIETLAQSNNTDAETMLTSQTNIDTNLSGLGKASVFMNTMSSFDPKEAGSIVSSLIDAKSEG